MGDHEFMILFEYVDRRGRGVITDWRLEVRQRAKLDEQLDRLRQIDWRLALGRLIHGAGSRHVFKIRVRGNVQLRPLLYRPPGAPREIVFVMRAVERDGRLDPIDALEMAELRRKRTIVQPERRRKLDG